MQLRPFFNFFLFSALSCGWLGHAMIAAQTPAAESDKTSVLIEYSQATYDFSGEQKQVILEGPITISTKTMTILCDHAEILSSRPSDPSTPDKESATNMGTIDYILAVGNVDIQQMGTRALAGKAEIFPKERRLVLEDDPRIIDNNGTVSGHRITFLQGERQIKIDPGDSGKRNKIQLNDISEIEFLMGDPPVQQPGTNHP